MNNSLIYVPGRAECSKCKFQLIQTNINANTGSFSPGEVKGDKCPNCNSPLWLVTWKDEAQFAWSVAEESIEEIKKLKKKIKKLETGDENVIRKN